MISILKALEIAEAMAVLVDYPRPSKAVEKIAEQIKGLCKTEDEADWLCAEIAQNGRHARWGGPAWLKAVYDERFGATDRPECRTFVGLAGPVDAACEKCGGFGIRGEGQGANRCECVAGVTLPEILLQLARGRSSPAVVDTPSPVAVSADPITQADIDAAVAARGK